MGFDLYGLKPVYADEIPEEPAFASATKEERLAYWNACDDFDQEHPGRYFRNNIWFWRPLWFFICSEVAPKILSKEDKKEGEYNNGYTINAVKANYIAERIATLDKSGFLDVWAEQWEEERRKLEEDDDTSSHYPFNADNAREFGAFCQGSGGFSID